MMSANELTEDEKARYDRQIRVWGAEAQGRIQTSKVLICGLNGLNAEVVKNIVLAGVSVMIQDSSIVNHTHLATNFFLNINDIAKNAAEASLSRIQALNTFATVNIETKTLQELNDDYYTQFNVILMNDTYYDSDVIKVNNVCRSKSNANGTSSGSQTAFFYSGTFGEEGWIISDFGDRYQYNSSDPPKQKVIVTKNFPSIDSILKKPWSQIISRHYPLSSTYVKSRVLSHFRNTYNRDPTVSDNGIVQEIGKQLLSNNGIDTDTFPIDDKCSELCKLSKTVPIMICSILGSVLSQEVIKAVSLSGEPGVNVFVFSADDYVVKAFPVL